MAIGVMPTASATRRMETASGFFLENAESHVSDAIGGVIGNHSLYSVQYTVYRRKEHFPSMLGSVNLRESAMSYRRASR
jgi:hypothetical protein